MARTTPGRFSRGQWLGGTDFDRSPNSASTIGPDNFGGSINLLSRPLESGLDIRPSGSYGSFNTRLLDLQLDSGQFGPGDKSSLFIDLHPMLSDGYETYNYQKQVAGSLKYQYKLSDKTVITAFVLSRCAAESPRSIFRRLEVFIFRKEVMYDRTTEANAGRVATSQLLA